MRHWTTGRRTARAAPNGALCGPRGRGAASPAARMRIAALDPSSGDRCDPPCQPSAITWQARRSKLASMTGYSASGTLRRLS